MKSHQTTLGAWRTPTSNAPSATLPTTTNRQDPNQENFNRNRDIPIEQTKVNHQLRQSEITRWSTEQNNRVTRDSKENEHQYDDRYNKWGDDLTDKQENEIRITLRNISSLPQVAVHNKNDILLSELAASQADIYCATEINLAWQNLAQENSLQERFRGKMEFAKFVSANNKDTSYKGAYQPGGSLIITSGKLCGRIRESGTEQNILQRWAWIKLQGRNDTKVVIATLYRPVMSNGPISTYQQHKNQLLDQDIDTCPRKHILSSLGKQIELWQQEGCQIIVTGDFNEDINNEAIKSFFDKYEMSELIMRQHGESAPNTMVMGCKPIDGVFGSNSIRVIRSGYQSFAWGMASDHRLLWIDVDTNHLLDTNTTPLWKPLARRLKCSDPRIARKFIKLRKQYFINNKGEEVYNILRSNSETTIDREWKATWEKLDEIRTASITFADKHCRRLRMGAIPWSPDLQISMKRISYLQRCRMKYINGYRINSRTLFKAWQQTNLDTQITDPELIIKMLKDEFTQFNKLKKDALHLRQNFLENLAEAKAAESNQSKEKIYQQLKLHENIRNTFRKIKFSIKATRNGVTTVEAPTSNNRWKMITEKKEIELCCIQENIKRMTQAKDTPTMREDQIQLLGLKADTMLAQEILEGNIQDTTDIHPDIINMIPFLSKPTAIQELPSISVHITQEEYKWAWKKSREYTSCGCSGLHFGHFKASSEDDYLCNLDKWFIETALQTGQTLNRWNKGIDVMIPKKVNSTRVDKLRTIVLMEPDFNFTNKVIGKRVMANAERANSVAPEQFGSRKKKSAIVHAVNKQLTTDILRQDRKDFCLAILDAKDCYGRITPMYASFSMKRQGATNQMMDLIFNTIGQMEHQIRTSFGDSEVTYKQREQPFHGILQGNGAGPTIWAMISTTLLEKLRTNGNGVKIITENGQPINITAFAFVDDTDLVQQLNGEEDITSPQKAVTEWSTALHTTGGSLVGEKCSFQIIRHKFHNNQWKIQNTIDEKIKIEIPNEYGELIPIRQNPPNNGEVALGVAFSPSGDRENEINYLKEKTKKWAEQISKAKLTTYEAWTALQTTIFKTVEYALPSTNFTKKEINKIISPALNIGLAKAGICRKISRKIIFAPNKFQGFGLHDPYTTQGILKLKLFFNPFNQLTQQLIHESWRRTIIECGIGPQMFLYNYNTYKSIVTHGWISNLWEFLSTSQLELKHIKGTNKFRMQNDSYLNMKTFERYEWSPKEKQEFNSCRMYLGVELLSDIITANGMSIRRYAINGELSNINEQFVKHTSINPKPNRQAWKTWKRMLRLAYNTDEQGRLLQSTDQVGYNKNWQWFYQPSTERIYRNHNSIWELYTWQSTSGRTRNKNYGYQSETEPPDMAILPITVYKSGENIKIDGIGTNYNQIPDQIYVNWTDSIHNSIIGDDNVLKDFMSTETIILLSDGSAKDGGSYVAWIITTPNAYGTGNYIMGYGKVLMEENTDSHRAECFGLLGAIHSFQEYRKKWQLNDNDMYTIVCDNKAAVNYAGDRTKYKFITSDIPDFDVLTAIRTKIKHDNVKHRHVLGHQEKGPQPHDIYTVINIAVDILADEAEDKWEAQTRNVTRYDYLDGEEWHLSFQGKKLFKDVDRSIREITSEAQIQEVWHKYKRVNTTWFQEVNWKAISQAMQKSSISNRQWILKRCARDCGAHAILHRRKERTDDKCPFCAQKETIEHVYTCQDLRVQQVWDQSLQELKEYLSDIKTDPNIIEQLVEGLRSWSTKQDPPNQPMIWDQTQIGWNGILEGILGNHWMEEQQIYAQSKTQATNGSKWAQLIVRRLWKIAWEIWSHRNEEAHRNDQNILMENLLTRVEEEIETGTQGYRSLEHLMLSSEIDKVRKGNILYIQCWLNSIRARRDRAKRREQMDPSFVQMRNTLRNFLRTT
jgi:Reverse transcriptase (RNA-dependent DNA polymerase)